MKEIKILVMIAVILTSYLVIPQPAAYTVNPPQKSFGNVVRVASGSAAIVVTDGNGPVSNAPVTVTVNGEVLSAITDASGKATLTNLPAGGYVFTVRAPGYFDASASVAVMSRDTAMYTISLSRQTRDELVAVKDKAGPSGRAAVPAAATAAEAGPGPVSGAAVSRMADRQVESHKTDAKGTAFFIPPLGNYSIAVAKNGYRPYAAQSAISTGGQMKPVGFYAARPGVGGDQGTIAAAKDTAATAAAAVAKMSGTANGAADGKAIAPQSAAKSDSVADSKTSVQLRKP
ncbi:MAG: carboxypeptidase-like regulatory domain-containing protein [Negativicutes bacterium]|nr:carboxypeptidase-like regulatory domain-containing protein [Negativicutes bacterium]